MPTTTPTSTCAPTDLRALRELAATTLDSFTRYTDWVAQHGANSVATAEVLLLRLALHSESLLTATQQILQHAQQADTLDLSLVGEVVILNEAARKITDIIEDGAGRCPSSIRVDSPGVPARRTLWCPLARQPRKPGAWKVLMIAKFPQVLGAQLEQASRRLEEIVSGQGQPPESNPPPKEQPDPLTPRQQQALEKLNGKAMSGDALAGKLQIEKSTLIKTVTNPLQERGLVKNDRTLGGYYRPDAPPPTT